MKIKNEKWKQLKIIFGMLGFSCYFSCVSLYAFSTSFISSIMDSSSSLQTKQYKKKKKVIK